MIALLLVMVGIVAWTVIPGLVIVWLSERGRTPDRWEGTD